ARPTPDCAAGAVSGDGRRLGYREEEASVRNSIPGVRRKPLGPCGVAEPWHTSTREDHAGAILLLRLRDAHSAGLRERLDEIDARIMELWLERAAISQEVGRTRVASGGTRLVLNRENEILDRYRAQLGPDGVQLALLVLRAGRGPL